MENNHLEFLSIIGEQEWIDSRGMAAYYGMQHKYLLETVDNKVETLSYLEDYVRVLYHKDKTGVKNKYYLLHRDYLPEFIKYGKTEAERKEFNYINALQNKVGGIREIAENAGSIDLLTETTIYEVAQFSEYKAAFHRILYYGSRNPNHKLVVVFFDYNDIEKKDIAMVVSLFNLNGVEVLFIEERAGVVIKHNNGSEYN